jgi:hypothetical protein
LAKLHFISLYEAAPAVAVILRNTFFYLAYQALHNYKEVEMTIRECLRMQEPDL